MRIFEQIDNMRFRLSKNDWSEEDRLSAVCIGLQEDGDYSFIGDVQQVWPGSLKMFLFQVFTSLYAENSISYKTAVFKQLNLMYQPQRKSIRNDFVDTLSYPKDLYNHQKNALIDMIPHKFNFLSFDMGLGKCNTLTTSVLTDKGVVKMGDIKIGDNIFGSNGKNYPVTGIFPQGMRDVYRIHFSDDTHADCDLDHLWIVYNNKHLKSWRKRHVMSTNQIMSDLINENDKPKYSIPYCDPLEMPESETPLDPYLLGLLLGDGCFRKSISYSTNDKDLIPVIESLLPSRELRIVKHLGNEYGYRIVGTSQGVKNPLTTIIRELGLFDKLSHDKFIPSMYLWNSIENRIAILQGLLDTDGHVNKSGNRISYTTVSPMLSEQVKWLINSLGGHCSIGTSVRKDKRDCFYLIIDFNNGIIPFRLQRRLDLISKKIRHKKRNIVSVEKRPAEPQQCISVDSPDHSYLINECIVTHNTITSASLSKTLKIPRTIIIAPAGVKWNWYHDMTDDWGFDPLYWTILDAKASKCVTAFIERFVVINYEMIDKHWEHLIKAPVGHIIIDEVHYAKNHKTNRYKRVEKLIKHFDEARVTMLSGTPITNRTNDLFAYFKLSGHPLGNNHSNFMKRYILRTNGFRGKIVGAKNIEELSMRQSNFMIRKRTEECLDLPKLIINKYYLEDTEITDEYFEVLKEMYKNKVALKEAQENKGIEQLENSITDNVHSLNRILATSKAKRVIELVDKIRSEGRKVIVFATYKSALSALEDHYGLSCVKIDGSVGAHKRSVLIEKFIKDPKCEVFLGNVKAAGVGINLVNASDVIFMNFPFTPDDIEQPQKRAHRIGQTRPVNVYYTIVKKSIDEHIFSIIVDKSEDINAILDKGKKGVISYGNIMNKVFNQLLTQYAIDNKLPQIEDAKYSEV